MRLQYMFTPDQEIKKCLYSRIKRSKNVFTAGL